MGAATAVITPRRQLGDRGFTLLELLVVLLLLALSASIAAPSIGRSIDALRVRAEVAGFAAVLRHAREQAITTRRVYTVTVDDRDHQVRVAVGEDVKTRALPATWTIETDPPHVALRFQPEGSSTGADYRITAGPIVYRVTVDALTGRVRSLRQ